MAGDRYFINYYDMFSLDRSMTEKEIRDALGKKMSELSHKTGTTNRDDTVTIKEAQEMMEALRNAVAALGRPEKRKKYDKELDAAILAGKVNTEIIEEIRDIMARARQCFKKEQYKQAVLYAREALDKHLNKEEPYEIISRSQFMMGDYEDAVQSLQDGIAAFQNSLNLKWLIIRYMIMMEEYNEAQALLNEAMQAYPGNALFSAEQIYLYGYMGKLDILESAVRTYISQQPNDKLYRKYVAYNLVEISHLYYLFDSQADMLLLTDEESYNNCMRAVRLANEIYQDDYVTQEFEYVKQFGEMVYDEDHKSMKSFYRIGGIVAIVIGLFFASKMLIVTGILVGVGILFEYATVLVDKCSYRPYWKVYRDMYRGYKEAEEGALYNLLLLPWDIFKEVINMISH